MSHDLTELLPEVMREALTVLYKYGSGEQRKTKQSLTKAKAILKNDESTATGVFIALQHVFGNNKFLAWEPESIWLELDDNGINDFPQENRDKVLATITLLMGDAFRWDALVFEKTMLAFNDIPIAPDAIQEASPGEIAWGAFEAEFLSQYAGHDGDYDYEPTRYTGASMYRAGFILAPELLVFAQEELDKFNSNQQELQQVVSDLWNATDKEELEDIDLSETPADVQIGRLASLYIYVGNRAAQLRKELTDF